LIQAISTKISKSAGGSMDANPNTTDIVPSEASSIQSSLAKQEAMLPVVSTQTPVIHINSEQPLPEKRDNGFPATVTLYNQTNKRLHIRHNHEEIVIPALGSKVIALEETQTNDTKSTLGNYDFIAKITKQLIMKGWLKVSIQRSEEKKPPSPLLGIAIYAALFLGIAFLIQLWFPFLAKWAWGIALVLIALISVGSFEVAGSSSSKKSVRENHYFYTGLSTSSRFSFLTDVWQNSIQWSSLTITILISVLLPGFVILGFGYPFECYTVNDVYCLAVFGRLLQFLFIALAGMLPALLYFLFDRQRLSVLRKEVERNIFRLDPSIETLEDVQSSYGEIIEEFYGSNDKSRRLTGGTRAPIVIATAMLSVGMIMTLLPVGALEIQSPFDLYALLLPRQTTFAIGFAGAYFFTMATIIRRYTLGDLTAKTYTHIAVRIITVIVLAWVLDILVTLNMSANVTDIGAISSGLQQTHAITLVIAFIIGVVPDTFWTLLREIAQKTPFLGTMVTSLKTDDLPLTSIAGVDIYERSRLYEEGITNLQGLVHYDIVNLMLKSRIPSARIVDWVDQAILELHLAQLGEKHKVREYIKNRGIRNTSDFVILYDENASYADAEIGMVIKDIYKTVQDDEWVLQIRYWRETTKVNDLDIIVNDFGQLQPMEKDRSIGVNEIGQLQLTEAASVG
jgi:hypothetical protein